MKKDLCAEVRASSANRMHSAAFLRNWSKLGKCASISFCSTLATVRVLISGNDRPRMVHEGLYVVCLNREAEPGFCHADQVSFAFGLTVGLHQELCRAYSAINPSIHVSPPGIVARPWSATKVPQERRDRLYGLGVAALIVMKCQPHQSWQLPHLLIALEIRNPFRPFLPCRRPASLARVSSALPRPSPRW
jgi:hypothetical protein